LFTACAWEIAVRRADARHARGCITHVQDTRFSSLLIQRQRLWNVALYAVALGQQHSEVELRSRIARVGGAPIELRSTRQVARHAGSLVAALQDGGEVGHGARVALLGGVTVQSHCLAHKALVLVVGSEVEHGRRVPRLRCRLQMRDGRFHVDAHAAAA
jgi:hypothetical protein